MGTPEFAVEILKSLVVNQFNIVGVITVPDKPAGRGRKINASAVKLYATAQNLKVLQPLSLKDPHFIAELEGLKANLQVVVAFRMLPEVVWKMPKFGTFNLHASLLPNYRGAAPINWAIINGETQTGVSTFFIDDKIDTGALILKKSIPIESEEDMGLLHDKLSLLGTKVVLETLHLIQQNLVELQPQDLISNFKIAPKLNKENCKIDWNKSGVEIVNLVRGLSPYPGAWTHVQTDLDVMVVKIFKSNFKASSHHFKTGNIIIEDKQILVAVDKGFVVLESIQLPNKKRMSARELLNGNGFKNIFSCF